LLSLSEERAVQYSSDPSSSTIKNERACAEIAAFNSDAEAPVNTHGTDEAGAPRSPSRKPRRFTSSSGKQFISSKPGAYSPAVERLMASLGLQGVIRGKPVRTTISDKAAPCPLDHVNRQFHAPRPNALWVSDFTYVAT
jgi:hypothetical protein